MAKSETSKTDRLKIAVLAGGISSEREISLQSGKCVAEALHQAGFEVVVSDIAPDNLKILDDASIDVFFVALHGEFGEDGQLQQILEDRCLCYTGSGPQACRLSIDKVASKKAFEKAGVKVPQGIKFDGTRDIKIMENELAGLGQKFVVKPVTNGSSVGVSIIDDLGQTLETAKNCLSQYGDCMIEQFIAGRELTVGVIAQQALPILEIRPKTGFYDYYAKYIDDSTEYLFDTIDDQKLIERISLDAVACFNALNNRHFARVDFILDSQGQAYALEINTIPGMTTHSCIPKASAKIGISMPDLCAKIVRAAVSDYEKMKSLNSIKLQSSEKEKEKRQTLTRGIV
ncbi:MAG: D-alanine--D-alanine ligase [Phycisphaerae bacterium]